MKDSIKSDPGIAKPGVYAECVCMHICNMYVCVCVIVGDQVSNRIGRNYFTHRKSETKFLMNGVFVLGIVMD